MQQKLLKKERDVLAKYREHINDDLKFLCILHKAWAPAITANKQIFEYFDDTYSFLSALSLSFRPLKE